MLERIGHIKNPLTVIAMFAAIAEVSGTIVLPLVDVSVQAIYVWFLMVFPCFLVLLFFVTLWMDHSVLYAPSDYKDETGFVSLFARGTTRYNLNPAGLDIDEATNGASEPEKASDKEYAPGSPSEEIVEPVPQSAVQVEASEAKKVTMDHVKEFHDRYRKSALYMQDVVTVMRSRYRAKCSVNASPKSMPNVTFDFVLNGQEVNCVGKTVFVTAANFPVYEKSLIAWLDLVALFYNGLSSVESERFSCVIAVVYRNLPSRHLHSLQEAVTIKAQELPFKVDFEPFYVDDLIGQVQKALDATNQ